MVGSTTDRIEKQLELNHPVDKVWRALTDFQQFGKWFGVKLDGPFVTGEKNQGKITTPGYDHLTMELVVVEMKAKELFSYQWHPYAVDPGTDYSTEPPTLVEFRLEEISGGTRLTLSESGFDALPANRRDEAFRMNDGGWSAQVVNIQKYLENE